MFPLFKNLLLLLLSAGFSVCAYARQNNIPADSAHIRIDSPLRIARMHSIRRDKVDWKKVDDTVRATAAKARTIAEVIPALQLLFHLLDDHHATIFYKGKSYSGKRKM